jgi:hypothetical protein
MTANRVRPPLGRRVILALAAIICFGSLLASAPPALAAFGLQPGATGFDGSYTNADGSAADQAGSYPFAITTSFNLNSTTDAGGNVLPEGGNLKDTIVHLPAGLVGNPQAMPRCPQTSFYLLSSKTGRPNCPDNTAVGILAVNVSFGPADQVFQEALYNLVPRAGAPAEFGAQLLSVPIVLTASVRTGGDYGLDISLRDASQGLQVMGATATFWGVPADPAHDDVRGNCLSVAGPTGSLCPAGVPERPLLRLPTACSGPLTTTIEADSWADPGRFVIGTLTEHDTSIPPNPIGIVGCDRLDFSPSISVRPLSREADSPTGLHLDLGMPQGDLPHGRAEADLRSATVELPTGMAVNPASADGLGACTPAQIDLSGPDTPTCPDNSKIATVSIDTPLLADPLPGSVYLASQGNNPFHSLLALYIVAEGEGVTIKLAGKVSLDPATGRLRVTFEDNPQLPFSNMQLHFKEGNRASLLNPPSCDAYGIRSVLSPWSAANPAAPTAAEARSTTSTFQVSQGPGGGACPQGGFEPKLSAGLSNPSASHTSPFVLSLRREDGTQRFKALDLTLPRGVTAYLKGVPYCGDAALAAISQAEGAGQGQINSPFCPAASQIGRVSVGVGGGSNPYYVNTGKAYLAGPYKGAPLSIAIVTPAVAGPFDLGNVVVRSAAFVDPETAQITIKSDPIPTILHGIPLDVRDIRVNIDRPNFTLAPTNCNETSVGAEVHGEGGANASVASRFQVGGCQALPFKPKLKLRLKGATRRLGHPALKAVVTAKPGEANIGRAQVNLPHGEFLDQGNLNKTCTKPVLIAGNCPKSSVYGKAKAWTPLLGKPLEGNVYLVGGYGYKLPALVADLKGQIRVLLVGKVDSGKNRGIRNTFEVVPDAPVSRFVLEMKGGKKYGLLENSENLCKAKKAKRRAIVRFNGQNGKVDHYKPVVGNECGKHRKGGKKAKKKSGHARAASRAVGRGSGG